MPEYWRKKRNVNGLKPRYAARAGARHRAGHLESGVAGHHARGAPAVSYTHLDHLRAAALPPHQPEHLDHPQADRAHGRQGGQATSCSILSAK